MFSSDFNFFVVALLTALVATGLGILFAFIAMIQMASRPEAIRLSALLTFAATIPCNGAALLNSWVFPRSLLNAMIRGVPGDDFMITISLFCGFVLLMITLGLLYGQSGVGTRTLKAGSISLIVVYVLGCIGLFS